MARVTVTPPINISGYYECLTPFEVSATDIFYCAAIRTFTELEDKGIDPYVTYYEPKGISSDEYDADVKLSPAIVTLISDTGGEIYVPNTYITSYPGFDSARYDNKLVLLKLGLTKASVDIDYILEELENIIKTRVGVTCKAEVTSMPYLIGLSHDEGKALETERQANIRDGETTLEYVARLEEEAVALKEANSEYEEFIINLDD